MDTKHPSLDTNVLLRLILRDQPKMVTRATMLLQKHETFAIADQAIIEVVYAIGGHYGYSRNEIVKVINALIDNQHLNMNRALFRRVLPYYEKYPAVSFTDCCLEAYATLNTQTPLYTFDKKLAKQLPHTELVV